MNNYYVYMHKTKDDKPFYVGKGKNKRAWSKIGRNTAWKDLVKQIGEYKVELVYNNLSEEESLNIEQELIASIGINNLTNILEKGGMSGESIEYIKAEESINDFINLCKLYDSLCK